MSRTVQSERVTDDGGGSASTSHWVAVYDTPPLDRLRRLEEDAVLDWLNRSVPSVGSRIDWRRYQASHRHWFASSASDPSSIIEEFLSLVVGLGDVEHGGDSLSPFDVHIPDGELALMLPVLLEIPEHHYLVAENRSWFACFAFEGAVDLAFAPA